MTATLVAPAPVHPLVAQARTWLGVRWQHQGRSRAGVDCAGLVVEVARVTHGNTFDLRNYSVQASDETMLALCRQHMREVDVYALRPGHVVVMRFGNQRHMGIITDYPVADGTLGRAALGLLHAYAISRCVVEHRLDSVWRQRIFGAFELKEVA